VWELPIRRLGAGEGCLARQQVHLNSREVEALLDANIRLCVGGDEEREKSKRFARRSRRGSIC
jgi:hypothetical protein